jgi:IPT/TIG domain
MLRRVPFLSLALIALGAALPSAAAAAKIPTVKSVKPLKLKIGDKLTITGKYFVSGKRKNTVIFLAKSKRPLFVKADSATSTRISVTVPSALSSFLKKDNTGAGTATRFQIRVLARRLSKTFTSTKHSPIISPASSGSSTPGAAACDPSSLASGGDADGDLLSNGLENSLHTNPCLRDTDTDGVEDGYEYTSALDLNSVPSPRPYPGKRPYPNPLDPSDANTDYDGDSLTLTEEYRLWATPGFGNHAGSINALALNYSDGDQTTGPTVAPPTLANASTNPLLSFLDVNGDGTIDGTELMALDFNKNGTVSDREVAYMDTDQVMGIPDGQGVLSDDEKDADHDGLTNYDETHGRMTAGLWAGVYAGAETPYPIPYAPVDYMTTDTDGDGVVDGLDDQDYDGWTNVSEMSRIMANGLDDGTPLGTNRLDGFLNPFNPCLPHNWRFNPPNAPDCMRWPPLTNPPTPFESSRSDGITYANKF